MSKVICKIDINLRKYLKARTISKLAFQEKQHYNPFDKVQ